MSARARTWPVVSRAPLPFFACALWAAAGCGGVTTTAPPPHGMFMSEMEDAWLYEHCAFHGVVHVPLGRDPTLASGASGANVAELLNADDRGMSAAVFACPRVPAWYGNRAEFLPPMPARRAWVHIDVPSVALWKVDEHGQLSAAACTSPCDTWVDVDEYRLGLGYVTIPDAWPDQRVVIRSLPRRSDDDADVSVENVPPSAPDPVGPSGEAAAEARDQTARPLSRRRHRRRSPVPRTALEASVSIDYETWLAGTIGGKSIGSVFAPGPAYEVDAGVRAWWLTTFYVGWERALYGAGDGTPYADLPTIRTWGTAYLAGIRQGTNVGAVGLLFEGAFGYSVLHQEATDARNGQASIDFGSFFLRTGLGASWRLDREVAFEPVAALTFAEANYNATATPAAGGTLSNSGNDGLRVGMSLSVAGTFDLPLGSDR